MATHLGSETERGPSMTREGGRPAKPKFILELTPEGYISTPEAFQRMKLLLKTLLRKLGWRCTKIIGLPSDDEGGE